MASFIQVYDELKAIAHRQLANSIHQTINTTGLVHEAYVKLASVTVPRDREHLVGLVTNAMRQILLDAARARDRSTWKLNAYGVNRKPRCQYGLGGFGRGGGHRL